MNGRRLFREYAQSKGKEAKEFVEIIEDYYNCDILVTKNNSGVKEETTINYKNLVHWIIKNKKYASKNRRQYYSSTNR